MFHKSANLLPALAPLLMVLIGGCQRQPEPPRQQTEPPKQVAQKFLQTALRLPEESPGDLRCEQVINKSIRGEAHGVPGVSGAGRWGMPAGEAGGPRRVRRSWSSLDKVEKKRVVDAFLKLKQTTAGSGAPGAERADYASFCQNGYARNLYDYYVELHQSAFVSMESTDMGHAQMPHMGPQFFPWHRYLLLRLEADMRQVTGDPNFALPYWDWADCQAGAREGENPCPKLFEPEFLGSHGSCTDGQTDVTGYLADQGFVTHLWVEATLDTIFNTDSIRCSTKPLQRQVGCSRINGGNPPPADAYQVIYERKVYDAEPYDSCRTDEDVSFRQYVEGFTKTDRSPPCILGGCKNHGAGHVYVGGDMGTGGAPSNDPVFFLHHVNVDRLWAMWQDKNRESAVTAADYGNPQYPRDWRGALFNFPQVRAEELFDFRALGYRYDTTRAR